jgi:hypothetical protein
MFSLNFLFIALYHHPEYSPGNGHLPELTHMEANFLRLSTDLKLSTTQADAVSRCIRNKHQHKSFKLLSRLLIKVSCFSRFHNENLGDPAPKNIRWLRQKVNTRTSVPGSETARIKAYKVPDNLGVPQTRINVLSRNKL